MNDLDYAEKIARAADIPLARARERVTAIEADAELRAAWLQVRGQTSDATIVTDVKRNGKGEIEVSVAPDPGWGKAAQRAHVAAENLGRLRGEVAAFELTQAFGHAPRTALPFFYRLLVRR